MALSIGRKGFIGAGLETSYGAPVAIADYIPFVSNSLKPMYEKIENTAAYGVRDKVFNSVSGKKWTEGDIEINADPKFAGYFLIGALGTDTPTNPAGSVYLHTITRNNSNVPASLTVVNDRVTDRQYIPGAAVKTLELSVSDGMATMKASMLGKAPITTTSGTLTTASGNLYSFKDAFFAFGSTVAAAGAATNLKPSDFSITIENNSVANFRHGEFQVTAETQIFFENVTDRDAYYLNSKKAAAFKLTGVPIGNSLSDYLLYNMYQTRVDSFELETGLANFYAEKIKLICEYDNANSKTLDVALQNNKATY
jgi:hypothetical protein